MKTQRTRCDVLEADDRGVVVENAEVALYENVEKGGEGLKNWWGTFYAEDAVHDVFGKENLILRLNDGREGRMLIRNVEPFEHRGPVHFTAAGDLE